MLGSKRSGPGLRLSSLGGIVESVWTMEALRKAVTVECNDVFKLPSVPGAGGFLRRIDFFSWEALLLREVDRRLRLTAWVARRLGGHRQRGDVGRFKFRSDRLAPHKQFIVLGALNGADESSTRAEFEQFDFVTSCSSRAT